MIVQMFVKAIKSKQKNILHTTTIRSALNNHIVSMHSRQCKFIRQRWLISHRFTKGEDGDSLFSLVRRSFDKVMK